MTDFSGKWHSTFGPMELGQRGTTVDGHYLLHGTTCPIHGTVAGRRLTFTYQEGPTHGEGWWELAPKGTSFHGQWRVAGAVEGDAPWQTWIGTRLGFHGIWQTDFGRMRLVEEAGHVRGFYELGGNSAIEGQCRGDQMTFTYREPATHGEGRFALSPDAMMFDGQWRPAGGPDWLPWHGRRVLPGPHTWLVVLEVPWLSLAADRDYSFGAMLREFFSRVPDVRVRQRFFTNEAGLRRHCREMSLIPEPVALVVATHGLPQGIVLEGTVVDAAMIGDCLRDIEALRLLHFSACLQMKDPAVVENWRAVAQGGGYAISGYSTSVDWAASAIIEFTYLDFVLSRGLPPEDAAGQLLKLLPFAGETGPAGTVFVPAGFRMVGPGR
jgi:hypothetical protein